MLVYRSVREKIAYLRAEWWDFSNFLGMEIPKKTISPRFDMLFDSSRCLCPAKVAGDGIMAKCYAGSTNR